MATTRSRTKATRRTDGLLGVLIPLFFVALAGYQALHDHAVDKYVIGVLLIFGLGSLGWRVDLLLEKLVEARASGASDPAAEEEEDDSG